MKSKLKKTFIGFLFFWMLFLAPSILAAADYYISTTGNDAFDGLSEATAWATFVHADGILQPGDDLIILDGTYDQRIMPTTSGSEAGGYITYRAKNDFQVILAPTVDIDTPTIKVFSCPGCGQSVLSYLVFQGIIARSIGEVQAIWLGSMDSADINQMTHHIIVRKCGFFGSAQETNTEVVALGNNLKDSLVEDIFAYGKSRKAALAFGCIRVTVRRAVLRYDYWEGDDYKPNDPRTTFSGYNTQDSVFENIIAIDAAPTPPGYSADRCAFAASGNETPAAISGSKRNKYLGIVVLNNYANGIDIDGGSGGPNEDLVFKDIFVWNCLNGGDGVNVQGNDDGSSFSFITTGKNSGSGIRLDPYPHHPISNESVSNIYATQNNLWGFNIDMQSQLIAFADNSGTNNGLDDNVDDDDLEPANAPDISVRLLDPVMVFGYERGATIVNRYEDGVLTDTPLWPYPHEAVIKEHMCNSADLAIAHRVAANGAGWEPGWCATDKSLTRYIWEADSASCPIDICTDVTALPGDLNGDDEITLSDAITGLQVMAGLSPATVSATGDVNDDSQIGLAEVVYIQQYMAAVGAD